MLHNVNSLSCLGYIIIELIASIYGHCNSEDQWVRFLLCTWLYMQLKLKSVFMAGSYINYSMLSTQLKVKLKFTPLLALLT